MGGGGINRTGNSHSEYLVCIVNTSSKLGGEINWTGNSHSEYLVCIVNTSSKLGGGR